MPFSGSSTAMFALGTLAPEGSVTVPRITPEVPTPWAKRIPAENKMDARTPVSVLKILTSHPLKLSSNGLALPQCLDCFLPERDAQYPYWGGSALTYWRAF